MTKLNNSVKNGFFVPTADLDDVERLNNANMMVENIVFTLANISADQQQHQELINNGLIEVLQKVVKLFTDCRRERNAQGINEFEEGMVVLKVMPTGALKMIKSVSDIINNLTQNTAIQQQCVKNGLPTTILEFFVLHDYKITTNLINSLGRLLTS